MGITSFTLSGLGVDAAVRGVRGTVPRPREGVKGTSQDFGPGPGNSWLNRRNHQFLPDEEAIAVGERVFFEDSLLRYAEAGGDRREGVSFSHDVTLLLPGSRDRRRTCGSGDDQEGRGRFKCRFAGVVLT
jgi:hypothetical protein